MHTLCLGPLDPLHVQPCKIPGPVSGMTVSQEVPMSNSIEVPEWVASIIMKIASHEGISPEQAVRLLIIQGALTYKRSEEARRDERNL